MHALTWRRASSCYANGTCIEVAWRTSSHSREENCVEIARGVAIRDNKWPDKPHLHLSPTDFNALLNWIKATA